jgi:hypothetical protein
VNDCTACAAALLSCRAAVFAGPGFNAYMHSAFKVWLQLHPDNLITISYMLLGIPTYTAVGVPKAAYAAAYCSRFPGILQLQAMLLNGCGTCLATGAKLRAITFTQPVTTACSACVCCAGLVMMSLQLLAALMMAACLWHACSLQATAPRWEIAAARQSSIVQIRSRMLASPQGPLNCAPQARTMSNECCVSR